MGADDLPHEVRDESAPDQHFDDDHHVLLVALLQNSQSRAEKAIQHKLNAIADSLADHMENSGHQTRKEKQDAAELRRAVGLEFVESSDE